MRATRAYIAGFGTAGSLLAGAAIVFVFASAVVSFQGWPEVGAQGTPGADFAGQLRPSSSRTQVRQFVAFASAQAAAVSGRAATAAGTSPAVGGPASGRLPTATLVTTPGGARGTTPGGARGANRGSFTSTRPAASVAWTPPIPCATCGRPSMTATLGAATQAATTTLGTTVATAGSRLGSVVTRLTGVVGTKLGAVSPGLGQVVGSTGRALGGTLGSATGTLGGTLTGVGNGLSGVLVHNAR